MKKFYLFPFEKIPKDSEIIIWGGGNLGKSYYQQLVTYELGRFCKLVDSNWEKICFKEIDVYNPLDVKNYPNAYIVIAVVNEKIASSIHKQLIDWGIEENRIIWCIKKIKSLHRVNLDADINKKYKALRSHMKIYKVIGNYKLTRIGGKYDGGYIMLDDFYGEKIAYSLGINKDVAWDKEMVSRGYDIYMYDHTIDGLPEDNEHFHWEKIGISDSEIKSDELDSLRHLIVKNGHKNLRKMILKMDIEGYEWGCIEMTDSQVIDQFDQIVFEAHGFEHFDQTDRLVKILDKLNDTHRLIHIHPNNYGEPFYTRDGVITSALELTYANKKTYNFVYDDEVKLPISIDLPCNPFECEVELGYWNREFE